MERLVGIVTPLRSALWFLYTAGAEATSALFEFDVTFSAIVLA
jgi:hypothetical protein